MLVSVFSGWGSCYGDCVIDYQNVTGSKTQLNLHFQNPGFFLPVMPKCLL